MKYIRIVEGGNQPELEDLWRYSFAETVSVNDIILSTFERIAKNNDSDIRSNLLCLGVAVLMLKDFSFAESYLRVISEKLEKGGEIFHPLPMVIIELMQFLPSEILVRSEYQNFLSLFSSDESGALKVIRKRLSELE